MLFEAGNGKNKCSQISLVISMNVCLIMCLQQRPALH